jgi:hypothetical protein
MVAKQEPPIEITRSDKDLVLASLEVDQLANVKKSRIPRRRLTALEVSVLWSLRVYLLFMVAVVIYQVWTGAR